MKKIKKINLDLNKEVISSLSNEDMNQVKGGASTYQMSAIKDNKGLCMSCPIDTTPTASGIVSKCLCLVSDNCATINGNLCMISQNGGGCIIQSRVDCVIEPIKPTIINC